MALVRTTTGAKDEPKKDVPPAAPREVVAVINRGGCGNCHVIPGVPGADGEVGPDLTTLGKVAGTRKPKTTAKEYIRESILDPDAFVSPGGYEKGVMPKRFGKSLSEDDLGELVDYIASLGVDAPKGGDTARPKLARTRPAEAIAKPFAPSPMKSATDEQIALERTRRGTPRSRTAPGAFGTAGCPTIRSRRRERGRAGNAGDNWGWSCVFEPRAVLSGFCESLSQNPAIGVAPGTSRG